MPDRDPAGNDVFVQFEELVSALLHEGARVLDVGTGDGLRLRNLIQKVSQGVRASWMAIDISEPMLEKARRNLVAFSEVVLGPGDGRALQFGAAEFDGVIAVKSCFDPQEAFRVLKSPGWYLCVGPGARDWIEYRDLFGYYDSIYTSESAVRSQLASVGFTAERYCESFGRHQFHDRNEAIGWFSSTGIVRNCSVADQVKRIEALYEPGEPLGFTSHVWLALGGK